jgi:hypothetical protein
VRRLGDGECWKGWFERWRACLEASVSVRVRGAAGHGNADRYSFKHTLVCDGDTRRLLLLLLEILKLVDLVRGLFVGMNPAITELVTDQKVCKHSIHKLTSSMPRRLSP